MSLAAGTAITQNDRKSLLLEAKADVLAALVVAGKIGETEGIKLVFGVAPSSLNKTYQDARAALKTAISKRQPAKFPALSDTEKTFRKSVGLSA